MARKYSRDSAGRFASGGGGGSRKSGANKAAGNAASGGGGGKSGKSTAAASRATNKARASALAAKGTTGLGSRVQAKGFAGGKVAQRRAGGLRASNTAQGGGIANTVGRGGKMSAAQRTATDRATKKSMTATSQARQKGVKPARTNKAPVGAAKAKYKDLLSRSRRSGPYRSAAENRSAAGARRSLRSMVTKRARK
jgi:hypothetical protein